MLCATAGHASVPRDGFLGRGNLSLWADLTCNVFVLVRSAKREKAGGREGVLLKLVYLLLTRGSRDRPRSIGQKNDLCGAPCKDCDVEPKRPRWLDPGA